MGFVKKEWKDRLVEFAGRRKLTNITSGAEEVVDVIRNEGNVTQEGDTFCADNMNDLETRVGDAIEEIEKAFQDGCDILVAECTTYGHTPDSNSPSDIANAIGDIYEQGKTDAEPKLQSKSATLDTSTTSVTLKPDSGYDGLSQAVVSITKQEKAKSITSGSTTVTPDSGKVLSKVTITGPTSYAGTTLDAGSVTSDEDYTYFSPSKAGYVDTTTKIRTANSNLKSYEIYTNIEATAISNGQSVTIDISQYTSDYANLSVDNIFVELTQWKRNGSNTTGLTFTKSYNASTGILTINSGGYYWSTSAKSIYTLVICR